MRRFFYEKNNVYRIGNELKLKIDYDHYYQWMMVSTNYYSFGIKKLLCDILRPGDVLVDVGANIGYISLLASSIVGGKGKVISFEPDPRASRLLKDNILLNKIDNIVLIEKACGDREGTVTLNLASHMGWSTALENASSLHIDEKIQVPLYVLDEIIKEDLMINKKNIRLIKIDVEGYEPYVLAGSKEIIKKNKTAFIIEINAKRLADNNNTINDIANHFERKNYLIYWINEKRGIFNSTNNVKLKEVTDTSIYDYENGDLLVIPVHLLSRMSRVI